MNTTENIEYISPIPRGFAGDKGLTLKDYFAIQCFPLSKSGSVISNNEHHAKKAYQMAEAMIKVRNKLEQMED